MTSNIVFTSKQSHLKEYTPAIRTAINSLSDKTETLNLFSYPRNQIKRLLEMDRELLLVFMLLIFSW